MDDKLATHYMITWQRGVFCSVEHFCNWLESNTVLFRAFNTMQLTETTSRISKNRINVSDERRHARNIFSWGNSPTGNRIIEVYHIQSEASMVDNMLAFCQPYQYICPTVLEKREIDAHKSIRTFERIDNFSVQIHHFGTHSGVLAFSTFNPDFF